MESSSYLTSIESSTLFSIIIISSFLFFFSLFFFLDDNKKQKDKRDRKLILELVLWYQMMRTSIDTHWDPTNKIIIWCEPQLTRFETQQKYWNTCPRKLKFRFFIEPWPNVYKWNANQRYKVWMSQGRIPDKFTVLEEPKEEQNLTFFYFIPSYMKNVYKLR